MKMVMTGNCVDKETDKKIFEVQVLAEKESPGEFVLLVYKFNPDKLQRLREYIAQIMEPLGGYTKLSIVGIECPAHPDEDYDENSGCWDISFGTKGGKITVTEAVKAN